MSNRKQSRGERTKALIADAAASVFAKKGYHGATVEEIAREAGYSPAAIYKYFKNKDAIFQEVIRVIGEGFLKIFEEPAPEGFSFPDRLRWFLSRQFMRTQKNLDLFVTFTTQPGTLESGLCEGKEGQEELLRIHREYGRRMGEMMAEGVELGALSPRFSAGHYALFFLGSVDAFIRHWIIEGCEGQLEALIEPIVHIFISGAGRDGQEI